MARICDKCGGEKTVYVCTYKGKPSKHYVCQPCSNLKARLKRNPNNLPRKKRQTTVSVICECGEIKKIVKCKRTYFSKKQNKIRTCYTTIYTCGKCAYQKSKNGSIDSDSNKNKLQKNAIPSNRFEQVMQELKNKYRKIID